MQLRNRRISPGQIRFLQLLWRARLRRIKKGSRPAHAPTAPASSSEAPLPYVSSVIGREVKTPAELSWREANQAILRLLQERTSEHPPAKEKTGRKKRTSSGAN